MRDRIVRLPYDGRGSGGSGTGSGPQGRPVLTRDQVRTPEPAFTLLVSDEMTEDEVLQQLEEALAAYSPDPPIP